MAICASQDFLFLNRHPSSAGGNALSVQARLIECSDGAIEAAFEIAGDVNNIVWPPQRPAARCDDLWRSTCLETFVAQVDGQKYWELNFAPSASWAAYEFDGYRNAMRNTDAKVDITLAEKHNERLILKARFAIAALDAVRRKDLRFGLCAITEDRAGTLAYWALAHTSNKPDFHRRESFIATIAKDIAQ